MKLFIDCEFNGYKGNLLSIALIDIEGREFYREIRYEFFTEFLDRWVAKNVVPKLHKGNIPGKEYQFVTMEKASEDLEAFLSQYDSVELIADWPDDVRYFCQLLITGPGKRIDTPPLNIEIGRDLDAESRIPHYAPADVHAIREKYLELENV